MDLLEMAAQAHLKDKSPLAQRMKPRALEAFIGQEVIMGAGKLLPRLIASDRLTSIILYGPPGSGKTSLAQVIAHTTKAEFVTLNAVTSGVKDIRQAVEDAQNTHVLYQKRTVLFIDEIHRFNKSQQDALLPYVEDGTLILIGATTENPFFEVNAALISRSSVFRLTKLTEDNIVTILRRALSDRENGLGDYPVQISDDVLLYIADISDGDARRALTLLELSVLSKDDLSSALTVTREDIQACFQDRTLSYDKSGDNHYDIVSAFIKSMRGSDPDAALYYMAKMIAGGEDPKFIARRVVICAAEDVGNADPMALVLANSAAQAVLFIGMPEARILLAQAVTYIACAPKSNAAYAGIDAALHLLETEAPGPIPYYLKDGTSLRLERHYVENEDTRAYIYPHDMPTHYVKQQYLPDSIKERRFYYPSDNGAERAQRAYLEATKLKASDT